MRYVLEGSVRKAGNRVRITGQLIEAATGAHVWAERYDRALDDIFAVQDEMTISVVGAIEPRLRQAEIERAKRKRPDSLDAYDLYLRGLAEFNKFSREGMRAAVDFLGQALSISPLIRARRRVDRNVSCHTADERLDTVRRSGGLRGVRETLKNSAALILDRGKISNLAIPTVAFSAFFSVSLAEVAD